MGIIGALGYTPMDFVLPQARPHMRHQCAWRSSGLPTCLPALGLHWGVFGLS